ncbi:MAG: GNAT family N-acetyltransferase [Bdellovibrionales bacterium]|nr:GNAT family N-acetyltransferase [Bdellovibrionales bacterium]
MGQRLFQVQSSEDLKRCYPVLKELRSDLTFENYISIYEQAHTADGYELVAIEEHGKILALMGYRFLADYVRGRHLYIDDLVSTETARSKGLGAELLTYAEKIAAEKGCRSLRLCTGVENTRGIEFYERNGWVRRAYAYTKKLEPIS